MGYVRSTEIAGASTPVGPPWITTNSGYFFEASKSARLIRMLSIVVPSLDFHCRTSRVASFKSFHCAPASVRYLGGKSEVG